MSSTFNYDDALGEYTFPNMGYEDIEGDDFDKKNTEKKELPRILIMGLRRSGKSSIQKVVFQKMSPNETLFLESTTRVLKNEINNSCFVKFQIWDFPGQLDYFDSTFDSEKIFGQCGSLIFILDAQEEDYDEALQKLHMTLTQAHKVNPKILFEVFIHKVDGLSDGHRFDTQRDIQQRVMEALRDDNLEIRPSFHLTSIYDHSIFEAMSQAIQRLIPHMDTLENLLDILLSNCGMEKAFVIDIMSKIYVATDSAPVDMQVYELCSDMIDVVLDLTCIYGEGGYVEDEQSQSVIKLKKPNTTMVLVLHQINADLALVCLMRESSFKKAGLITYNFRHFKKAIMEVLIK